jgi:hypothetical protein
MPIMNFPEGIWTISLASADPNEISKADAIRGMSCRQNLDKEMTFPRERNEFFEIIGICLPAESENC